MWYPYCILDGFCDSNLIHKTQCIVFSFFKSNLFLKANGVPIHFFSYIVFFSTIIISQPKMSCCRQGDMRM